VWCISLPSELELLAFNAQKYRGSRDTGDTPFSKNFKGVMSGLTLGTCLLLVKFEVCSFNRFRAIIDWSAVHRHTDRRTHIERKQYLRHSLRSLGGDNKSTICSLKHLLVE